MEWVQLYNQSPMVFYITLAIVIAVSWAIGLTPSLLLRYAILKKPVTRKTANWVASLISLLMFIGSIALELSLNDNAENKAGQSQGAAGVVLLFFASRWVLQRPIKLSTEKSTNLP